MGVQERKQRQFAEREQVFLDRAWVMIQRDGLLNLQMARLAAECDYAVGTLYQHFSSKEDLLVALAARRIGERIALFQRAAAWHAPTRSRMFAVMVADVLFAHHSLDFFRLAQYVSTHAVWAAASPARRQAALDGAQPLGEAVQRIIDEALAAGDLASNGVTARELCGGLWAMSAGMHMLVGADGVLESQCVARPYQLLLHQAHALLNGLGWQSPVALDDVVAQQRLLESVLRDVFPEFPMAANPAALNILASGCGEGRDE